MGFHEVPECSITFRMLLSPSIRFYAMFFLNLVLHYLILSYLILSYLIFLIFCLPAGFWCWDDFKYPRGYPHVQQRLFGTDLTFSNFLNFYFHLGLITTPHVLYVHMTYVYSFSLCFILHTITWPREVIIVL